MALRRSFARARPHRRRLPAGWLHRPGPAAVALMEEFGLKLGEEGVVIYVMAKIPSNVILAKEFTEVFDGFSIGSNDLTQLTLGIDRDSAIVSHLFDERNEAVTQLLAQVIGTAKAYGRPIGLCGQAPSDYPEFARFLVEQGIDSISFTPDALLQGLTIMVAAEAAVPETPAVPGTPTVPGTRTALV